MVGPYVVEVDVRTSLMQIIPHALVQAKESGGRIRLAVSAPGYLPEQREIRVRPGVWSYPVMVKLADRPKRFDVFDFQWKPLPSCYFDRDQTGTPTDRYAINLFIPIKSWPHPNPANVIVNQPGYGIPIQESCEISVRDAFYRVRMLIDRRVLDDPHDELLIYVNTAEVIDAWSAGRWFAAIRRLEVTDPAAAAGLARAVFPALPAAAAAEAGASPAAVAPAAPGDGAAMGDGTDGVPDSIARLLRLRRRFEALHRPAMPADRSR